MIGLLDVSKSYGHRTVVHGLTMTVDTGTAFGLLGQNGAGKTTTMKMLVGLTRPSGGTVTVGGASIDDPLVRSRIGFMPESPYFYERLTGLEFMRFCGELFGGRGGRYEELLARVGLHEAARRPITTYSKGMKQRLGFAQALVADPEYLFLDEPLDGLDPLGRREMKNIIHELRAEGRTIFFNSHILYDTEVLCDEVGIIHDGELIARGTIAEFTRGKSLEERFVEIVEAHRAIARS